MQRTIIENVSAMNAITLSPAKRRYDIMIGTGGIGSGSFFLVNGDHTLGREESRSGRFLDKNDYCKLHIIAHYVKALLGPGFRVVPVGKVGNDDTGRKLLAEMQEIGMSVEYVETDPSRHTLFSFCFLYPDRSGGNMTTDDSACSAVDANCVAQTENEFQRSAGRGVALAAPEVPLEARITLLDLATRHRFLRVASFTSEEMRGVMDAKTLEKVDLLCINLDEAASAVKKSVGGADPTTLVIHAAKAFSSVNPGIQVSITNGKKGSYVWDGQEVSYLPVQKVEVVSTAGAGDAFTAGLIVGMVAGLTLKEAQELANLTGACSVTSPHTINKDLHRAAVAAIVSQNHAVLSTNTLALLEDGR
jgi:sugar/nucleoside kinase (ribokinase family)